MPYIKSDDRMRFNEGINSILDAFYDNWTPGDLNYVVSMITWELFLKQKKYQRANDIIGALEGVKMEFYRRLVVPYENEKITENGDLDIDWPDSKSCISVVVKKV